MSIKGAAVDRLSGDLNSRIVQRRSRIETDGIAARTGNGGDEEAKEIVRRFERALSEGKRLYANEISAARTGNEDNGEAKEIVRRFERALSEGKSLDQAQMIPVIPQFDPSGCQIL